MSQPRNEVSTASPASSSLGSSVQIPFFVGLAGCIGRVWVWGGDTRTCCGSQPQTGSSYLYPDTTIFLPSRPGAAAHWAQNCLACARALHHSQHWGAQLDYYWPLLQSNNEDETIWKPYRKWIKWQFSPMLGRTNTLVRMAPDLSRNREQQERGAAKHRASTDNLCLTSSPGQPGNFHISPGLLSLPISGVLHNTQHNNSPSFLNCLLSIKLAKYLKRWNKQIRGCIKTEVAMSAAQVTLRDTFHIHNLYLHHSQEPGQVTGEPGQDQMWSRVRRRGYASPSGARSQELGG